MEHKSILLVEDNADDEILALRALQRGEIPVAVVVARDGQEALDYLFAEGNYAGRDTLNIPNLILMDLKMPKVGGLAVLQKMRGDQRTKYIPVVIMTSSREERDLLASYDLGANSYMRKPLDFAEFSASMKILTQYWLTLNERPQRTGN